MSVFILSRVTQRPKFSLPDDSIRMSLPPLPLKDGEWILSLSALDQFTQPLREQTAKGIYLLFGCMVYRNFAGHEALRKAVVDIEGKRFEFVKTVGSFCIIQWGPQHPSIITDFNGPYPVFCDANFNQFSNSFQTLRSQLGRSVRSSPLILAEKLATGFVLRPETLLEQVYQLDLPNARRAETSSGILFVSPEHDFGNEPVHQKGFSDSIERQAYVLESHFQTLKSVCSNQSSLLGLSGGYDSRLLLACSHFLPEKVSVFTHDTQGVHSKQRSIIQKLADVYGMPLCTTPSRHMEDLTPDEAEQVLTECLDFFDQRSSRQRGAFSETYTRKYNQKILEGYGFFFHGVGGEVYRNHTYSSYRRIHLRDWFERHVIFPFAREAINDDDLYEAMYKNMLQKISLRLGEKPGITVDIHWIRRYYSLVRVMDSDAIFPQTYSHLVPCHAPFLDAKIIREGLKATPYIGYGDEYEAALINRLSPSLGSIPTEHGFPPNRIPRKEQMKARLRTLTPDRIKSKRIQKLLLSRSAHMPKTKVLLPLDTVRDLKEIFYQSFPKGNFEMAMLDAVQRPTTLNTLAFLRGNL